MPADTPSSSDVTADDLGAGLPGRKQAAFVTLAFQPERPLDPPLRLSLQGVDAVWFSRGRGPARGHQERSGSEAQLRVEVPDKFLSSSHASLQRIFGRWLLEDAGSRNGTFVDGARVEKVDLKDGTVFEIGHSFFVFRAAAIEEPVPQTAESTGSLHPVYAAQLRALERAAGASLPVVLRGETGTGKEVLARRVHELSRRPGAFQAINCAALAPTLLESELFGYRKGAFSGALEDRPGLVRSADKGTLFLDEIGDLPLPAQGAFLRVLQESEVLPVGGTRPVPVDFRLVVATHRNLEAMAEAGGFRKDLLARMSGFSLWLPPLRERMEDLGLLIAALLRRHAPDRELKFSAAAARALFRHQWHLNVRELEKTLLIAATVAPDRLIDLQHLPEPIRTAATAEPPLVPALAPDEAQRREELLTLLREHHGNVTAVAKVLGKARVQVQRWMRRYGIQPAIFR
jgi:transcriptional regulator of acetoin/glycerol metabolism